MWPGKHARERPDHPAYVMAGTGEVVTPQQRRSFVQAVQYAYSQRVALWSDGFYATPKIHYDRATASGRPFYYFAYGAAASEVIVDTLTGEYKTTRVDILHDVGSSLNPAVDLGQIEVVAGEDGGEHA